MKESYSEHTFSTQVKIKLEKDHPFFDNKHFYFFIDTFLHDSYTETNIDDKLIKMLTGSFEYFSQKTIPKIRIISNPAYAILKNSIVIEGHARNIKFLLDSIREYLNEYRFKTKLIINPIFSCYRDKEGKLIELKLGTEGGERESFIHIEIKKVEKNSLVGLEKELNHILYSVQSAVEDFKDITSILTEISQLFKKGQFKAPMDTDFSLYEAITFLDWLLDENFVFLGYRAYEVTKSKKELLVQVIKNSGKGLMREDKQSACFSPRPLSSFPLKVQERINLHTPLIIDKTPYKSSVHRRAYMDFIEIREFGDDNKPKKWHRFIGLFTRKALFQQAKEVPLLNTKLDHLIESKHLVIGSSMHREVLTVFNSLPKEVLFFNTAKELDTLIQVIISAYREQAIRIFLRASFTGGAISIVVALPEKYFSSHNNSKLAQFFKEALDADSIQFYQTRSHPGFWEIYFFLSYDGVKEIPVLVKDELEKSVIRLVKEWEENLFDLIEQKCSRVKADKYIEEYLHFFSEKYQSVYPVTMAVKDIEKFEQFYQSKKNQYEFLHPDEINSKEKEYTTLRIYSKEKMSLTRIMPVLENLGLNVIDESAYYFEGERGNIHLQVFAVTDMEGQVLDQKISKNLLREALERVIDNQLENGILNALILKTGLNYRQINLIRTYYNYYFQIERIFTRKTVAQILIDYSDIFRNFFNFFDAKFNPDFDDDKRSAKILDLQHKIIEEIKEVTDINQDRILKAFYNLVDCTLRTNYYSRVEGEEFLISIKIESGRVVNMPDPKPLYEIYVYSPVMEGIHLRGGRIARGGLRWSDRIDDYRTEILALMKTQMTKNTVIVPVGSKGGFILRPNGTNTKDPQYMKTQYQKFISGLLDLTDNIVAGDLVHPKGLICYDGDDPYLVVAADKGTAHLSDAANEISANYKFWLDDAFASGGSYGYDHKKEGITAKGAWECVKRHFRELGKDIQEEEFSVIAIGDMAGDVFGNGMLLSRKILLKAAFNHIHIFIDPNPEAEASYLERERLFRLPKSSWEDYNSGIISRGGGVFLRNDKAITLSDKIKDLLDIPENDISGNQLIRYILKAKVELLWNGGVGTYVKSSIETHEQVGDKSNDRVRVDGNKLRVKVVGEGGNLGFTQLARVEFAYNDGLINTDAIDNSAGVDMSDHEVNLKVLFSHLQSKKLVKNLKERNTRLVGLTDELNHMIVKDNYLQSMAISIDALRSKNNIDRYKELIGDLSHQGLLDVRGEFMPNDKEINTYKTEGIGLLRPQLAILLGYEKMRVYETLLDSKIPDLPYCELYLISYFPDEIYTLYKDHILEHRLKREIIATVISNNIINHAGVSFFFEMKRDTSYSYPDIAGAYLFVEAVLGISDIRKALYLLDYSIPARAQYGKIRWMEKTIRFIVDWNIKLKQFLIPDEAEILELKETVWTFQNQLQEIMTEEEKITYRKKLEQDVPSGLPEELVKKILAVDSLDKVFMYLPLSREFNRSLLECHQLFEEINKIMSNEEVMGHLQQVHSISVWDQITENYIIGQFQMAQYFLCKKIFEQYEGVAGRLFGEKKSNFDYYNHWVERLKEEKITNYQPFVVILKFIWNLTD